MSANDITLYVFLAFLTIMVTIFNNNLRKHINGEYKKTENKQ